MTTETKNKGEMLAEARAAKAEAREQEMEELRAMVKAVVEENKHLQAELRKPPVIPISHGPEKDLQRYSLAQMKQGEQRTGNSVIDFMDPNPETALQPNDIVRLNDANQGSDFQHKIKAFRESLNMEAAAPVYGKVLQLIGPTKRRRGPRKYKVHVQGVGRDGFTEDELILEQRAG